MIKDFEYIKYITDDYTTDLNNKVFFTRGQLGALTNLITDPTIWDTLGLYDASSFIKNIVFFPCKFTTIGNNLTRFSIKANIYQNIECRGYDKRAFFKIGQLKVDNPTNFYDYSGYTKYELFLPYFGVVELNANDIVGKYIQIRLLIDFDTGSACYYVGVSENQNTDFYYSYFSDNETDIDMRIIATYTFQLGMVLPINATNANDINRNILMGAIKTVGNIALGYATSGSPLGVSVSTVSGAEKLVSTDINPKTNRQLTSSTISLTRNDTTTRQSYSRQYTKMDAISEVFSNSTEALNNFNYKCQGDRPNNSALLYAYNNKPVLIKYEPKILSITNDYTHLFGLPCGYARALIGLTGYTEISKIHIEGEAFKEATSDEIEMLQTLLTGGIIL